MSQQNVQGATAKPTEASHEFNSNEYRATYSPMTTNCACIPSIVSMKKPTRQ